MKNKALKNVNLKESIFELEVGNIKPGASLASLGVDMRNLCSQINAFAVKENCAGKLMRVKIIVNTKNKSFNFEFKGSPTVSLLKEKAGLQKGTSDKKEVGTILEKDVEKIAELQLSTLNTKDIEKAKKIILGTAKSIGLKVV